MNIWVHNSIEYKGFPITIGDWEMLGKYLRGMLLDDLKYQADFESRVANQRLIQMRDYDESDIMMFWGRSSIYRKVIKTIFKNDLRITNELITEFDKDPTFVDWVRYMLKESGIRYSEDNEDDKKQENPPQSPSAESE